MAAPQLEQFWLIVIAGCCQPFHDEFNGQLKETREFHTEHFDLVEFVGWKWLHNGQHPINRAQCADPIDEWQQMAEDGARIVHLFSSVLNWKMSFLFEMNCKRCVGREQALNTAKKIEHLVVEMAEEF